jgi:hypothetical protein
MNVHRKMRDAPSSSIRRRLPGLLHSETGTVNTILNVRLRMSGYTGRSASCWRVARQRSSDTRLASLPSLSWLGGMATASELTNPAEVKIHDGEHDRWLDWLLPILAILLPVIVLLVTYSIPRDAVVGHEVGVSMQRGDFLVPVFILCVEAIRRWWRNVKCGRMLKMMRLGVTVICGMAATVSLIATTTAASISISTASGRSISTITVSCFIVAATFSTLAFGISLSKADG